MVNDATENINLGSMLTRPALIALLAQTPPLVEGLRDMALQVQPAGIDLTVARALSFTGGGDIAFTQPETTLATTTELPAQAIDGNDTPGWHFGPGVYKLHLAETVHIPHDIAALGRTRSTLIRCGGSLITALWDPGYSGRSEVQLVVSNPHGLTLRQGARVLQLVFFRLDATLADGRAYQGRYQGENITR